MLPGDEERLGPFSTLGGPHARRTLSREHVPEGDEPDEWEEVPF
jgi:hypothetical protein